MNDMGICEICKYRTTDMIKEPCFGCTAQMGAFHFDLSEYDKQIKADTIKEVSRAMYHQCFECNNDEDIQKWDSGNWFRYKLFENVMEQLKESEES